MFGFCLEYVTPCFVRYKISCSFLYFFMKIFFKTVFNVHCSKRLLVSIGFVQNQYAKKLITTNLYNASENRKPVHAKPIFRRQYSLTQISYLGACNSSIEARKSSVKTCVAAYFCNYNINPTTQSSIHSCALSECIPR